MIYNHIPVTIGCLSKVTAAPINYQYDQVQILQIRGIELPTSYRVDFSNPGDAATITMVGSADGVEIPNQLLLTGLPVIAYVVLTGTDENAVETRYQITLPVNKRPPASDIEPTTAEQSTIDSLIAAINDAVDQTAADVITTGEDADAAARSASDAEAWAVGQRGGVDVGTEDETYQNNSSFWAGVSKLYADRAQQGAQHSGYIWGSIDENTGELIIHATESIAHDVTFKILEETGELIISINE